MKPQVCWTDEEIKWWAYKNLPNLPILYVDLKGAVTPDQKTLAIIEWPNLRRINRRNKYESFHRLSLYISW